MAYVRRRGNQVAIVQGEREPGTGKVQQRILFTVYSKPEALEILGRGEAGGDHRFKSLLESQFPELRLNWKQLRRGLAENLEALPDQYEYRSQGARARFRSDLCAFTRQLILADPQDLMSAANLLQDQQRELEYLADLIQWRLKLREQKESQWNTDNRYDWRFNLRGGGVPPDTEEEAAGFYERGDYGKAKAVFQLLIDCFDGYAEGYNYLGLIALAERKLDEAIGHFEKTAALGRKLFPARITKKRYWSDHDTRPYLRGLRNLALTLNQAGRFDASLALCDRLENECGDDDVAAHRAPIFLNLHQWERAADQAMRSGGDLDPSAGFIEAFALFELGRFEEVLPRFLRAALYYQRTARMLVGERTTAPKSNDQIEDHNTGVELLRSLHAYLKDQRPAARKFFRGLVRDPRVSSLLEECIGVVDAWHTAPPKGDRSAFDRMNLMRSRPFADAEAQKLRDLLPGAGGRRSEVH